MKKIALVTGGSRGIGEAIVELLGKEYEVYYTYHSTSPGDGDVAHPSIHPLRVDSRDYDAITHAVAEILEVGPVSVLVNNAGITKDRTCLKMSKNEWDEVIELNLNAVFYYTKACLQGMVDAGWGRIINISSIIGLSGGFGQANYAASKAGVIGFTKSLALELATKNITVNAIAPGYVDTDMTAVIPEKTKSMLVDRVPMKRFGERHEVASMVRYLASEEASYITGQVFNVSGGL